MKISMCECGCSKYIFITLMPEIVTNPANILEICTGCGKMINGNSNHNESHELSVIVHIYKHTLYLEKQSEDR